METQTFSLDELYSGEYWCENKVLM